MKASASSCGGSGGRGPRRRAEGRGLAGGPEGRTVPRRESQSSGGNRYAQSCTRTKGRPDPVYVTEYRDGWEALKVLGVLLLEGGLDEDRRRASG